MGAEPANYPAIEGWVKAGKLGTPPFFEPGKGRRYDLEFRFLIELEQIATFLPQI